MGRGKGTKARIQEVILRRRGLEVVPRTGLRRGQLPPPDGTKTLTMRLLEAQYGVTIQELIRDGTIAEVAKSLGIEESTVSKWRLRLGLRTKGNNHGQS